MPPGVRGRNAQADNRAAQAAQARARGNMAMATNTRWQDEVRAQIGADALSNALNNPTSPPQANNRNMGNRGGRNGGGGGAPGKPTLDQIRGFANQDFAFNAAPYDQMRAANEGARQQALAYNPDFAAIETEYANRARMGEAERAAAVQQRLDAAGTLGNQLAGQNATALAAALRDLNMGGDMGNQFVGQANAMGADRQASIMNNANYMAQLNANAAGGMANDMSSMGLIRAGGEANLANNRGQFINQLATRDADIAAQQAQAQTANDAARREFLLRWGVFD